MYGASYINNEGSISASATGQYAFIESTGAAAANFYGSSTIVNSGDISATSRIDGVGFAYATGVSATTSGVKYYADTGVASISNYGDISGTSSIDRGYSYATGAQIAGKYSSVYNAADAVISATASADTWGLVGATGVQAYGKYSTDVVNHGTIEASAISHGTTDIYTYVSLAGAVGVYQSTGILKYNDASLSNYGDINATAISYDADSLFAGSAGATGIVQRPADDGTVNNFGNITAYAHADVGLASADGIFQVSGGIGSINNYAGATITAVAVSATLDGDVDGYGGRAVVDGTRMTAFSAYQYNGGEISQAPTSPPAARPPKSPPSPLPTAPTCTRAAPIRTILRTWPIT